MSAGTTYQGPGARGADGVRGGSPTAGWSAVEREGGAVGPWPGVSPLSFGRLVRVELRKALDTRGGRGLVAAIVVVTALTMGVLAWVERDTGASFVTLLLGANVGQAILLPVLGILTVCSEWSQRTVLVTFTQEPRRLRVMGAKTLAAVLIGVVVLVVTAVLALLGHVISVGVAGGEIELALSGAEASGLVLAQVLNVLQGVAFGALLLSTPLAIVAFFLVPVLVGVVTALVPALERHAAWLDIALATEPLFSDGWLTGQEWQYLGASAALWLVLPLAVGMVRVARREVT